MIIAISSEMLALKVTEKAKKFEGKWMIMYLEPMININKSKEQNLKNSNPKPSNNAPN